MESYYDFDFDLFDKPEQGINFEKELNKEQFEAAMTTEGPLLIIAGAGSGKTRCLTYRTANLIEKGVAPEQILLLTFTNKAANEMKSRICDMLDDRGERVEASTYHSFCVKALRQNASTIMMKSNFFIRDMGDCADIIDIIKNDLGLNDDSVIPKAKQLVGMFSYCVNKDKSILWYVSNKMPDKLSRVTEIEQIYDAFVEYKQERSIMDYDDLLIHTNRMLREHPEIAKKYSSLYRYIMVDEYQDSNQLQFEFLSLLRQFDNQNLCVVGDEQQSLYSFRGADYMNILNFPKQFNDTKVVILDQNYRSNQEILDLANAIIANAKNKMDKELKAQYSAGKKPLFIKFQSPFDEARSLAMNIQKRIQAGQKPSEIAVLARTSNSPMMLEMELTKRKISFNKYGGLKFMDRAIVKDVFAFLRLMSDYTDEISWFRALQVYPNIGAGYAKKIGDSIVKSDINILKDLSQGKGKYKEFLPSCLNLFKNAEGKSLETQVEMILDHYLDMNIIKIERANKKDRDESIKATQLLVKEVKPVFLSMVKGYKNAADFVNEIMLESNRPKDKDNSIVISTIHSAKGLEFDTVFIQNCTESAFFSSLSKTPNTPEEEQELKEDIEERRRLLYVAVTRARKELFMTMGEFTQNKQNEIPYFLQEGYTEDTYEKKFA